MASKPASAHRRASVSLLPEAEEQRADLARDLGVDDREHRRPSAARSFAPDGETDAAARPQHAPHLAHGLLGIGHVHEAERAQRDVEAAHRAGRALSASMRAKLALRQPPLLRRAAARRRPSARTGRRRATGPSGPTARAASKRDQPGAAGHVEHALARRQRRRAPAARPARRPAAPATAARSRPPPGPSRSAGRAVAASAPCARRSAARDDDFEVLARHDQRVRRRRGSCRSAARSGRAPAPRALSAGSAAKALCTGPYQVRKTSMKCAAER